MICAQLDQSWTVSVGGQVVSPRIDGSFQINNILAPDLFGLGGPGTSPDFFSDQYLRVVGTTNSGGVTRYAYSSPFQIRQGQAYTVGSLIFTDSPPLTNHSLLASASAAVITAIDQTSRLRVLARLSNGTIKDVTSRTEWTVYYTSNPGILTIDMDGLATAKGAGSTIATAVNEGAVSSIRILVAPGVNRTTIDGTVELPDGTAVAGAELRVVGQGPIATSSLDGSFVTSDNVAVLDPTLAVTVSVVRQQRLFVGSSGYVEAVPSGRTHTGVITLRSAGLDRDSDGIPDVVEAVLGMNPDNRDSDRDGLADGDEDQDNDGLTNFEEVALGTILEGRSGVGVVGDKVAKGSTEAGATVSVFHPEPIEAFAVVIDHTGLPVLRYEQSEELQSVQPEFVRSEEISAGKSRLVFIVDYDAPHDFRTLLATQATEVFRIVFDVKAAKVRTPVKVVRTPVGVGGVAPEFTVNGR